MAEEHDVFAKYLRMIQEEAFRCKSITERLLEFSRTGEPRREPTELRGLVQAVLDVTQHLPNHRGKKIVFEVPPERGGRVTAWVNGEEIKSVILNLVVNALENMDEDGTLTIRLAHGPALGDEMAELRFIDTGCGMTPEVLENVFEPFLHAQPLGQGHGAGPDDQPSDHQPARRRDRGQECRRRHGQHVHRPPAGAADRAGGAGDHRRAGRDAAAVGGVTVGPICNRPLTIPLT